ncbi:ABC transporter permease [Pseudomonas sp. LS-2]|uniref:ABC transporter permease n=1 Tax=Pseudomonas sp. LS-2 TaxID=2315859 RepID=UPI000E76D36E|nr:ABC transporter permease [Pseudomonas sp. LS-2]RJX77839.1 ABC transporter permease [Pseudomonas sp. LS-2]
MNVVHSRPSPTGPATLADQPKAPVSTGDQSTLLAANKFASVTLGKARCERIRILAIGTLGFLGIALLWLLISRSGVVKPLFLPSPDKVIERLTRLAIGGELLDDLLVSTGRILVAFGASAALALPIGVLIGRYRSMQALLEPLVNFIRYMPVVAFVPLTILWTGTGELQKYLIIWIGTFFQMVLMVQDNVKRVPKDFIDVGRTLEMSGAAILWRIVLPSARPGIWDAMRICIGWSWSWLVVAELVAATSGLGYRITVAQRYFQTDTIIAYVLLLGVLGLITDQIMKWIGSRLFKHTEGGQK